MNPFITLQYNTEGNLRLVLTNDPTQFPVEIQLRHFVAGHDADGKPTTTPVQFVSVVNSDRVTELGPVHLYIDDSDLNAT